MNFIKKGIIETNGNYRLLQEGLSYVNHQNELILNGKVIYENAGDAGMIINGFLFYGDKDTSESFMIPISGKETVELKLKSPFYSTFTSEDVIIDIYKPDFKKEGRFLANSRDFSVLKDLSNILDKVILDRHDNFLLMRSLKSDQLFGYSLSEERFTWEIKTVQGILISDIRLSLTSNELAYITINKTCLTELDITTGTILRCWNNKLFIAPTLIPTYEERRTIVAFNSPKCFMKNNTLLVGLSSESYWEIDLASGAIKNYYLSEYFKSQKQQPSYQESIYTKDDRLFFSSSFYDAGIVKHSFGAFDINTKKIVARHDFKNEEVGRGIYGPMVSGNHLYLADFNHRIHVFEIN